MAVTMREVAKRAGVSKATVSYVLNGRESIPEGTRRKVLTAIREMGYHPNAVARSLAHRQARTIAVVMQYPNVFSGWSGFINELMHGVTDAAIAEEYDVLLHTRTPQSAWRGEEKTDSSQAELATLTDGRVDGALLLRDINDPLPTLLTEAGFPNVLMFSHSENPKLWFVDCDNVAGARIATEHLLKLGHQRILHLAGIAKSGPALERKKGFLDAMKQADISPEYANVAEVPSSMASFEEALSYFELPAGRRPTALFAWSDEVAITLMAHLRKKGLHIPQDLAVVGYDSTALCDHTDPPLTSVRQPVYEMAMQSLHLLVGRLNGETPEQHQIRVPPHLNIRQSCGAVLRTTLQ